MRRRVMVWVVLLVVTVAGGATAPAEQAERTQAVAPASAVEVIRGAIARRQPVAFNYQGAERVVHPHRLGISATGKTLLRAWEVSKAGAVTGQWKLYDVRKVRAPRPLPAPAPFPIAPGYTPSDKALRTLLAEVPYEDTAPSPPPAEAVSNKQK